MYVRDICQYSLYITSYTQLRISQVYPRYQTLVHCTCSRMEVTRSSTSGPKVCSLYKRELGLLSRLPFRPTYNEFRCANQFLTSRSHESLFTHTCHFTESCKGTFDWDLGKDNELTKHYVNKYKKFLWSVQGRCFQGLNISLCFPQLGRDLFKANSQNSRSKLIYSKGSQGLDQGNDIYVVICGT